MEKKYKVVSENLSGEREVFSSDDLQEVLNEALAHSKKTKGTYLVKESATDKILSRFGVILG